MQTNKFTLITIGFILVVVFGYQNSTRTTSASRALETIPRTNEDNTVAVLAGLHTSKSVNLAYIGQDLPSTDIYTGNLRLIDSSHEISNVINLTRRNGYDNQPSFSRNGRYMFYNSMRDGQTDIYRHDFSNGTQQVTTTAESEYSPALTPDNSGYSTVVVEGDGTQRLWYYTHEGDPVRPLLERVEPVGYYSWLDSTRVALFVLGEPPTLRVADIRTGLVRTVSDNPGRSLQTMPGSSKVAWLDKSDPDNWMIRMYDPDTRQTESMIPAIPGSEDFAWTPYGSLIMARRSLIFEWDPMGTEGWTGIADLSKSGVRNITRLAVSPSGNRIAIVADH
ncbi:MAG: hypothetical protein LC662_09480 [Rhodothermaceae bacterium]|nr:hypothetical protein [Rhodothermaceae bacterium]